MAEAPADLAWAVVDAAPDGMIVTDADGTIVLANRCACDLFGYPSEDGSLVGHHVDELLPESLRRSHRAQRARYSANPHRREMGSGLELLGRRADGTEMPVEVSLSPVVIGATNYVVAAVRDVTLKRAANASLYAAQARVAMLGERERIARDLHDSAIQRLYGAGLALDASLGGDVERIRAAVHSAVDEIDGTISEIRGVIHDLRLDSEHTGRIADRVQRVVDAQSTALDVQVTLHAVGRPDDEPEPAVADAVVAVVRECIANAHRHGAADEIVVVLETGVEGALRVAVSDNGAGFDSQTVTLGYGLENLATRAAEFGGIFTVNSAPGSGTDIAWEVPLATSRGDRSRSVMRTLDPA